MSMKAKLGQSKDNTPQKPAMSRLFSNTTQPEKPAERPSAPTGSK